MTTIDGDPLEEFDLTNCDREPIHLLGKTQSFGCLLAVDNDWRITHVSANSAAYLGRAPEDLFGLLLYELLSPESVHAIRNRLQFLRPRRGVEVVYDLSVNSVDRHFDVSVHCLDTQVFLEFEPAVTLDGASQDTANVRNAIDRMAELPSVEAIYRQSVRFIKAMTGFDRVMLYKFAQDGSGQVVAEAKNGNMEPFLNLRYPASDIPKQARLLYLENPIRLICDVMDDGEPVLAKDGGASGTPIDLSGSRLRSVSPIHLEYLRNMNVGASMSISIIVNGQLWGLIACHHNSKHVSSMRQRNCALLFGQMLSLVLQTRLTEDEKANDLKVSELTARISRSLSSGEGTPELLASSAAAFTDMLKADGYAIVQEGTLVTGGKVPGEHEIAVLCDHLNKMPGNEVFATHQIGSIIPEAEAYQAVASGVLSIPISRSPRDYILFFREELVQQVHWAGNPEKPVSYGPNGARLTPRKSFETWQETVRGQSTYWTPADLRSASQLRIMLLEVVLRLTDEAGRERKVANEKQELLIAELNHRVRNILGLVRGLVSQTNSGNETTEEFVSRLDSRIQSLARAHDQITRQNWLPASLSQLIETEAESYLLDKKDRVVLGGRDVLLTPQAFSSLALVMHEMITNSAKYGAISDTHGTVEIIRHIDETGGLSITWQEKGGPKVVAPERRGFGSTIIERTIPFELKGQAEIDYHPDGVVASFWVPAEFVVDGETPILTPSPPRKTAEQAIDAPKSVLIVEDNLIIALDAEEIFRSLGVDEIVVASSVEAGLREIEKRDEPFEFALLDINLGTETSYPVGLRLKELDVPFVFASGYGEGIDVPDELEDVFALSKPYDKDMVAALLTKDIPN